MNQLSGRTALITGAGTGIGRAVALALAGEGATIGVHYNSSRRGAEETLAALADKGAKGVLLAGDLTEERQAIGVVDQFVAEIGRLDILFNNAGSAVRRARIEECPTELWRRIFDVNLTSAFMVTRQAIPHLRKSGKGAIVNNLTLSIQTGGSGGAGPYAAAKGALHVFTRTLSRELAPHVRANAIMPGVIETAHHEAFSTPERMQQYRQETPLARNGTAEEVAAAVLFLVSDAASFMTGAVLDISGGRFLR
jgi:3-oxoacyl-[acyl-carrier protein] reductase